jgi:hypothetical protein
MQQDGLDLERQSYVFSGEPGLVASLSDAVCDAVQKTLIARVRLRRLACHQGKHGSDMICQHAGCHGGAHYEVWA